ncbi:MAG: tRNA (adenosine(37)-N6)-threonylcarbamoyltransferase complex dimerization subunit type 1 TsaB [bacterium]
MNTILCIDTASDIFALACDRDGAITATEAEAGQNHSRLLLPAIGHLLAGHRPDAILVVIGPGAYAGVRVGIATAEGLSLALGVPLYGIGTLEAVVAAVGDVDVTAVHPAGRGEFAAQRFVGGRAQETPRLAGPDTLGETPTAGEGAGALGGIEISSSARCVAALKSRAASIRAGELPSGTDAFYLREPSITISRRQQAAAS